ncbi:MAG TPA: sigma-70 family RNA polymerase sigma factor [Gemmatimonadaceae bacterium]|nr:sigma-70 family RNA polymerase sigma factor [Gemmatimonadaceae bacterium]
MPALSATAVRLVASSADEERAEPVDRTLVERSLAGDEQAFRLLYRRHTPRVLRLVGRLTGGNAAESDDVMQEVWLRAMLGAPKLRWTAPFQTWLCGIAVRVYAESRRDRLRQQGEDGLAELASAEVDIGYDIDIDRALAELPEHYRAVFILHDIEGHTHEDIAEQLGIAPGTSKSNLHRARRQLRVLLKSHRPESTT